MPCKFAGPWPRACQITDFGNYQEQEHNFTNFIQVWTRFTIKISIEQQLLKLLLLLLMLLFITVSCSIPGARGGLPGSLWIPRSLLIFQADDFFSSLFLTPCVITICSRVECEVAPKWEPKVAQGETVKTVLPSRRELTLALQAGCKNASFRGLFSRALSGGVLGEPRAQPASSQCPASVQPVSII